MANITCPMPGKILDVKVAVGDTVAVGQEIIVIESMKMEIPIAATEAGTVKAIHVTAGAAVAGDAVLAEIE